MEGGEAVLEVWPYMGREIKKEKSVDAVECVAVVVNQRRASESLCHAHDTNLEQQHDA